MIAQLIKDGTKYYKHNKWTKQHIINYSEKKFRCILKYAYKNSAFYKNFYLWKGIKYTDLDNIPINEIPTINKSQIKKNFYKIATKPITEEKINKALNSGDLLPKIDTRYIVHTSGSTGIPTNFLYDEHALNALEANFTRLSVGGDNSLSLKDFPIKSLYIAPVGSGYACTALAIFGMKKYHCKSVIINAQTPLNEWKTIINNYNPCYLSGYPSCLNLVASLVKKGEISISPKKIITGGEPLNRETAFYYKEIFKSDVIDYYGCTESICIGAGTTYYDGLYLFDDLNYIEKDDKNRLIITPLYNKAFPLIRYQLTDVVQGFNKNYSRQYPYTHIDKIIGRDEELMWFINENNENDFLHPLFLDDLNVKGIIKYQFKQIGKTYFELKCINSDINEKIQEQEIRNQIDVFLKNKNMRNVKYCIRFIKNIPRDKKTGKTKLVVKL
ncbi:AMP-binding protein [Haloimpatiens sp. FM7330]|uniref:AMP-binding protein n=1 Tax=Haloimpatiens sp. FM7330 TaxID=3298610 RepID=UPI00362A7FFD